MKSFKEFIKEEKTISQRFKRFDSIVKSAFNMKEINGFKIKKVSTNNQTPEEDKRYVKLFFTYSVEFDLEDYKLDYWSKDKERRKRWRGFDDELEEISRKIHRQVKKELDVFNSSESHEGKDKNIYQVLYRIKNKPS